MATNYQRGRAFEYRVRNEMTRMGAVYIMRAAQSKGAADLIVLWPRRERIWTSLEKSYVVEHPRRAPWLVQCKLGKGGMPPAERELLIDIADQTGSLPILARQFVPRGPMEFINLQTEEVV